MNKLNQSREELVQLKAATKKLNSKWEPLSTTQRKCGFYF